MEHARILICEDEGLIAKTIERSLTGMGYEVAGVAGTGHQAIQLTEKTKPDLALMDIQLRGSMDGVETAGILREQFEVPVIFLTAFADNDTLNQAKEMRPLGYLVKPFEPLELQTTIETGLFRFHKERDILESAIENSNANYQMPDVIAPLLSCERLLEHVERREIVSRVLQKIAGQYDPGLAKVSALLKKAATGVENPMQATAISDVLTRVSAIRDFTDLLVLGCSHKPLRLVNADIKGLIIDAMTEFCVRGYGKTHFRTKFPPEELNLTVDMTQVILALLEVFSNAYEAAEETPAIDVVVERIFEHFPERLNADAKEGWYVRVRISDYGKGMSVETLERAFEPFFTTSARFCADGMGLVLVDRVMRQHHGGVHITSDEEKGTNVFLYFPENWMPADAVEEDPPTEEQVFFLPEEDYEDEDDDDNDEPKKIRIMNH